MARDERRQGTFARVSNVGGSITAMLVVAGIAWLIRRLRSATSHSGPGDAAKSVAAEKRGSVPALSPDALRTLEEKDPIRHAVIDVRPEAASTSRSASELRATHVPLAALGDALVDAKRWPAGPVPHPDHGTFLVFVSDSDADMYHAAQVASGRGFRLLGVLAGGLEALWASKSAEPPPPRFINRDALALLLGQGSLPAHATATVLDVRRHDERSLFGAIPGTWHVPVEELPAALNMSSEAWLKRYRFPRPSRSEPVVMQCRTNRRAVWAAAMARDAGYDNVLVYKQGAFGWRLSSKVKAYASYEEGDDVPLAKKFDVERVDEAGAMRELEALGLLHAHG